MNHKKHQALFHLQSMHAQFMSFDLSKHFKSLGFIGCLTVVSCPLFAADFFTIIGPDGRPMVIQRKDSEKNVEKSVNHRPSGQKQSSQPIVNDEIKHTDSSQTRHQPDQAVVHSIPKSENNTVRVDAQDHVSGHQIDSKHLSTITMPATTSHVEHPNVEKNQNNQESKGIVSGVTQSVKNIFNRDKSPKKEVQPTKVTVIDGVKYIDNEYLEDREFNLEGRKRFYMTQDFGGGRKFETVEREKGITKSVLNKFINAGKAEEKTPVVLASTYYRMPKDDVVQSLEQTCFADKKIKKAKVLGAKKEELGIWPVKPIKEKFAYEVVKLDQRVQNIQVVSYASSQNNPNFYWPFVVFLDQQGCVIEGVSGFKNENKTETNFSHSALEGVLIKPPQAVYLFMTPLVESIDAQNVQLSNQGQIKLTVLQ
ncbi:putative pilus assembly protein FilE [Acinetobacter sp. 194]|uniref:putative pilus assembly protein FilE n=1 Tax=Acinetobacter shaoyimingii TaxID=2715164 RepID=UPI00140A3EF0|nr:putative pilus assembly protein FilE [Acinetobacter shaoyimingii]NHB59378.1 putative pilus assembly protein FilE [Acinetobacter shaoyimingii]